MKNFIIAILMLFSFNTFAQNRQAFDDAKRPEYKYRISTPIITVPQMFTKSWDDRKHTRHIELHFKRILDDKNIVGVKFATWRLFQPMGILWWDGLKEKLDSETEFYPGHVREVGLGVSYQRMLWKGLFATLEVLPQHQTYLDENQDKIGNGFKLYTSYHLGYHFSFGKNKRFFIEPQVHCQNWFVDTNAPAEFDVLNDKWKNHFLFEPNLYFGINF